MLNEESRDEPSEESPQQGQARHPRPLLLADDHGGKVTAAAWGLQDIVGRFLLFLEAGECRGGVAFAQAHGHRTERHGQGSQHLQKVKK